MHQTAELVIGAIVVIVLLGFLISSFDRHMRWEVRLFRWRLRIFLHCVAFVAIIAIAAFAYYKIHGFGGSAKPTVPAATHSTPAVPITSHTSSSQTSASQTSTSTTQTKSPVKKSVRAAPGKVHTLHVSSIHVDGSKKNTWIVFTHTHGQHFDINASLHRQLRAGSNYICHVQGLKLLSCRR